MSVDELREIFSKAVKCNIHCTKLMEDSQVVVPPVLDPKRPPGSVDTDGYLPFVRAPGTAGNSAQNDDKTSCKQFHLAEVVRADPVGGLCACGV